MLPNGEDIHPYEIFFRFLLTNPYKLYFIFMIVLQVGLKM